MNELYLGMGSRGEVRIANDSVNRHILIVGMSGSGKSVRLTEMEMQNVDVGRTVIAIDINGTHKAVQTDCVNYINVIRDGLGFQLLNKNPDTLNNPSVKSNMIAYVVDVLSAGQNFGVRQKGALRRAVEFALEQNILGEIEAIQEALLNENSKHADSLLDRMWNIFEGDFLKKNKKVLQRGKLNIVSFCGINPSTRKILIDIFLAMLWKKKRESHDTSEKLTITIDEFQNIPLSKGAILAEMLTEARQYDLNLILATQTLARYGRTELSLLNQAAVKLFFRPGQLDVSFVAAMIDPDKQSYWNRVLTTLKVGQAVTYGNLYIESTKDCVSTPMITKSKFGMVTTLVPKGTVE